MNLFNNIQFKKFFDGAPQGVDQMVVSALAKAGETRIIVLRDDARLTQFVDGMRFVMPEAELLILPAWDCLPYDRVSPHSCVTSSRLATLSVLAGDDGSANVPNPRLIVTTVNGWLQKVPPPSFFAKASLSLRKGQQISVEAVTQFLAQNGFHRTDTVREYGEFAVRGGIVDIYSDAAGLPTRLDFFGDEIDTIKSFDPGSQRSTGASDGLVLQPATEFLLDEDAVSLFRSRFREFFGGKGAKSPLYESVSAARMTPALEHWSALLHDEMAVLEDYCTASNGTIVPIIFDEEARPAIMSRQEQIAEFYQARQKPEGDDDIAYFPLPPHWHYRTNEEVEASLEAVNAHYLSSFSQDRAAQESYDAKGRGGLGLAIAETGHKLSHIAKMLEELGKDDVILIAATSEGAARRTGDMLQRQPGLKSPMPLILPLLLHTHFNSLLAA